MKTKKTFLICLFICTLISNHGTIISMRTPQTEAPRSFASRIIPESIRNWYNRSQTPMRRRLKTGFYMVICGFFAYRIFRTIRARRRMIGSHGVPSMGSLGGCNPSLRGPLDQISSQISSMTTQLKANAPQIQRELAELRAAQQGQSHPSPRIIEDIADGQEGHNQQAQTLVQPVIESLSDAPGQPQHGSSAEQRRKTF